MDVYKTCQICYVNAPAGTRNQNHYGAICCVSCKAFFRRCHRENSQLATFKCKKKAMCNFSKIKRHKCKFCRYRRCREVGMMPNLVLQGEERAKHIFPKRKEPQRPTMPPLSVVPNQEAFLFEAISHDFVMSCAEIDWDIKDFNLINGAHLKKGSWGKSQINALLNVRQKWKAVVTKFCHRTTLFKSLNQHDQERLIDRNGDLYGHYIFARYLTATNGEDQINWLLGANAPIVDDYPLRKVGFKEMNGASGMIFPWTKGEAIEHYLSCAESIAANFQYPCFFNGLLLHLFIFNTDGLDNCAEMSRIHAIQEMSVAVIKYGCHFSDFSKGVENLHQLVKSLKSMSETSFNVSCPPPELIAFNTNSLWIQTTIKTVKDIYQRICPDFNFIQKQIAVFQGNKHVFPSLHKDATSLFHLRFQTILDTLLGFEINKQCRIEITKAYEKGTTLQLAKFISCRTLLEQVQVTVGKYDLSIPELESKAPIGMDYLLGIQSCIDPQLKNLVSFVQQEEMYWLLMIFVLLDSIPSAKILSLHKTIYICLIKMIENRCNSQQIQPELIMTNFIQTLNQTKVLLRHYNF